MSMYDLINELGEPLDLIRLRHPEPGTDRETSDLGSMASALQAFYPPEAKIMFDFEEILDDWQKPVDDPLMRFFVYVPHPA